MPTPASSANLNQQATDYANIAKACLAVARCTDMTTWGIGEPDSWIPGTFPGQGQGLLYDSNYQPKAAYTSFLNALEGSAVIPTPTPTMGGGVTPTPTHTPTSTPTPTPIGSTPTPTPTSITGGGACSVHYAITNQWQGGFGASISITNTSSTAINGWSLKFSFPNGQTVTQLWNGSVTQSGSAVTITNASYNASIPAGAALNSAPGFNGSWTGSNSAPTAFTLNGATCTVV